MKSDSYAGKLKDSLFWWLSSNRDFIINDEYKLELLHIDREHNSAKIRITNLKTKAVDTVDQEMNNDEDLA